MTEGYRPGDILLFDFSGRRAKTEHAGILERLEPDGTLVTLEGNTGAGSDANGGAGPAAPDTTSVDRRRPPAFRQGAFLGMILGERGSIGAGRTPLLILNLPRNFCGIMILL